MLAKLNSTTQPKIVACAIQQPNSSFRLHPVTEVWHGSLRSQPAIRQSPNIEVASIGSSKWCAGVVSTSRKSWSTLPSTCYGRMQPPSHPWAAIPDCVSLASKTACPYKAPHRHGLAHLKSTSTPPFEALGSEASPSLRLSSLPFHFEL